MSGIVLLNSVTTPKTSEYETRHCLSKHSNSGSDGNINDIQKLERLLEYKTNQHRFRIPSEQHEVKVTVTLSCLCDLNRSPSNVK